MCFRMLFRFVLGCFGCFFSTLRVWWPVLPSAFVCLVLYVCAFAFPLSDSLLFRFSACLLLLSVPPLFCFSAVLSAFWLCVACRILLFFRLFASLLFHFLHRRKMGVLKRCAHPGLPDEGLFKMCDDCLSLRYVMNA